MTVRAPTARLVAVVLLGAYEDRDQAHAEEGLGRRGEGLLVRHGQLGRPEAVEQDGEQSDHPDDEEARIDGLERGVAQDAERIERTDQSGPEQDDRQETEQACETSPAAFQEHDLSEPRLQLPSAPEPKEQREGGGDDHKLRDQGDGPREKDDRRIAHRPNLRPGPL
ncbi:MAG: hypothetical protein WA761_00350 [Thermoplasmata archaeon]